MQSNAGIKFRRPMRKYAGSCGITTVSQKRRREIDNRGNWICGKNIGEFSRESVGRAYRRMKNDWILHMRNKRYSRMAAGD